MGKFSLSGNTPKKVLYNGVEVKKILFNNVEVWRKAIEAGSKSIYISKDSGTKTLSITVPDGVTKLRLTKKGDDEGTANVESFAVTPGSKVTFTFKTFLDGRWYWIWYDFNNSGFKRLTIAPATITVEWSEQINNS